MSKMELHYKPQGPTLNAYIQCQEQRAFICGPLGCLPGDSEFLTPAGWKRMDAYQAGDEVAVWSDGAVKFERAEPFAAPMEADERFIRFASGNLVMELSPEHTVPYFDYRGVFQTVKAGQMAERPSIRHIPTTFSLARQDASISDEEIRLRVMIAADAHYPKAGQQCFVCVRKPRKVERVAQLLDAAHIPFDKRLSESRPTEITFVFQRPAFDKSLGFIWGLSSRQLAVVIEEAMLWDGLANHEELRFFTAVPEWADAIQFAAHATGRRATIRVRTYEGKDWKPTLNVYITNHGSRKNAANVGRLTEITGFSSPDGRKYCFHTSTGYFVARCQGTVFITGNSSKTNASCWKSFRVMTHQHADSQGMRKTRICAVRNTYGDLLGTTVKDWLEMFGDLGKYVGGGREPPCHYVDFDLPDGTRVQSEMIFLALDREEDVKKLRGMQLTAAWLNEVKELAFGVLEMLDLRVGRYPSAGDSSGGATWHGIFGDTNACDTDHWYYALAEETRPEGWAFFRQPGGLYRVSKTSPWQPNPRAENLRNLKGGSEYYIKGAQGKHEDWIAVNLANEYGFVKEGKPVYPDYRDSVMCREFNLVKELGIWIGLDFGLTPAATIGQRSLFGQWRVRHELVTQDTGIQRFADELNRFLGEHYRDWPINGIAGDPAGGQRQGGDVEERTVFQLLANKGIECIPAPGDNDIVLRIEAFSAPMRKLIDGEPGILIHPDCKVLRKACQGGYAYKRIKVVGTDRYRDIPDKDKYSHPADAGQYMMLGAGEANKTTESTTRASKSYDGWRKQMGLAA